MGGLATDRSVRVVLVLALFCAIALAAARLWADTAEAPESWWRLRWAAGAGVVALAIAAASLALAWRRRRDTGLALPLVAAATVLLASVAAAL